LSMVAQRLAAAKNQNRSAAIASTDSRVYGRFCSTEAGQGTQGLIERSGEGADSPERESARSLGKRGHFLPQKEPGKHFYPVRFEPFCAKRVSLVSLAASSSLGLAWLNTQSSKMKRFCRFGAEKKFVWLHVKTLDKSSLKLAKRSATASA
jgi:hypothetical protein